MKNRKVPETKSEFGYPFYHHETLNIITDTRCNRLPRVVVKPRKNGRDLLKFQKEIALPKTASAAQ